MPTKKSQNQDLPASLTAPRYMDIPTFMRTHLITDPAEFDIAIIGVPYDGAVTNRPGARHGPRELRNASSLMRTIHHVTRVNPYEVSRISDGGDVHFTRVYEIEPSHAEITNYFATFHEAGVVPLAAGGDHSITFPILRAIVKDGPVGLIHVDAHTDTWDEFMGSRYSHGSPFRRGVEENLLDPKRTIQIGIRGAQTSSEGWDYSRDIGMRVIFIEEFNQLGVGAAIAEARRVVSDGRTYLSFDIDSLDPACAPGTGTPEVGGLTSIQAQELLRGLRGLNLIGADVVEVAPAYDQTGNTALVGATMMYEILCLLAEAVGKV